jgi:hypothetical protein
VADSVILLMKQMDGQVAMNLEIDGHSVFFSPHAVLPTIVPRFSFCADSKGTDIQHNFCSTSLELGLLDIFKCFKVFAATEYKSSLSPSVEC